MVTMCWQTVFMSSVYIAQEVNYGQEITYKYKILNALSSQLVGLAFGLRVVGRLVVWRA